MTAAKDPTSATPTRAQRLLVAVVAGGAVLIAGIGFAGSYKAVRELALKKGFGNFAYVFPVGVDAGICVLLALDLLLTWIRIPFPLLRQTAWLLTVATVVFNAAAADDPLGMAMHAVIPVLFVVTVEAARHAVGRIADITADKHMEGVRLTRWLLSPAPTFLLWRRMKLWELRSYDQVIKLEQERLVYQARLRSRFGRGWRKKAPVESLMPLRLARYGVPLHETAAAGLTAAGIRPLPLLPAETETAPATTMPAAIESVESPAPVPAHAAVPSTQSALPRAVEAGDVRSTTKDLDTQAEQLAALDLHLAYDSFLHHYGDRPGNAREFAEFLAAAYQITAPATGGPIAEALLVPLLTQLRRAEPTRPWESTVPAQTTAPDGHVQQPPAEDLTDVLGDNRAVPSVDGGQDLESALGWNTAAPGTAQTLELEDSNPGFQQSQALSTAGTPADRTGGSNRVSVQVRIPAQPEVLDPASSGGTPPHAEDEEHVPVPEESEAEGQGEDETPEGLKGLDLLEWHYDRLPEEQRALSANKLAPQIAELMPGYTAATIRKYIGELRRAAKQSAKA